MYFTINDVIDETAYVPGYLSSSHSPVDVLIFVALIHATKNRFP